MLIWVPATATSTTNMGDYSLWWTMYNIVGFHNMWIFSCLGFKLGHNWAFLVFKGMFSPCRLTPGMMFIECWKQHRHLVLLSSATGKTRPKDLNIRMYHFHNSTSHLTTSKKKKKQARIVERDSRSRFGRCCILVCNKVFWKLNSTPWQTRIDVTKSISHNWK